MVRDRHMKRAIDTACHKGQTQYEALPAEPAQRCTHAKVLQPIEMTPSTLASSTCWPVDRTIRKMDVSTSPTHVI